MAHKKSPKLTSEGFTLMELIVAMGLLGLVLILLSQIFINSGKSQEAVQNATNTTMSSRNVIVALSDDVRNSVIMETPSANQLRLQLFDGVCKSWQVTDGELKSQTFTKGVTNPGWITAIAGVSPPVAGAPYFATTGKKASYTLNYSTGGPEVELTGTLYSRNDRAAENICW